MRLQDTLALLRRHLANLPKHAKEVFAGDLIVPQRIQVGTRESKGGYQDIDLNSVFVGGSKELDGFLDQAAKDGERCGATHAVLETGPKAVAGVRADDGPGRAFLHLPPSVQSVVGGGIGRVVETTRLVLR